MKKKSKNIIWTFTIIVIIAISIVRIFQIFFTLGIYYDYAIWCKSEDAQYIKSISGINTKFQILVCKVSFHRDKFQSSVMKRFPTIFGEKIEIENGNNSVSEYVHENANNKEAILICSIPYIVLSLLALVIYYKILLPRLTKEDVNE